MKNIYNINNIPKQYISKFQGAKTMYVGNAVGSEKIYVNIDCIEPGYKSTKYHHHSMQEEFFLIMSGKGIIRINDEEFEVKSGDVISKPAGKNITHQFINNSEGVLQILDVGTKEDEDIAIYPDENILYVRNKGLAFKVDDDIISKGWTSDPNE
ncbi:cupin domain-containing protein [Clostridium sp. Marseille-QA1073]